MLSTGCLEAYSARALATALARHCGTHAVGATARGRSEVEAGGARRVGVEVEAEAVGSASARVRPSDRRRRGSGRPERGLDARAGAHRARARQADRQTDRQTGRGRQRGQRRARPRGWTRGAVAAAGTSLRWRYQLPPKAQPPTPRAWPAVRARAAAGAPTWRLGAVELARRSSEARRTWAARRRATCRPSPAWRRCSSRRRASCRGTPSSGARASRQPPAPSPQPRSPAAPQRRPRGC